MKTYKEFLEEGKKKDTKKFKKEFEKVAKEVKIQRKQTPRPAIINYGGEGTEPNSPERLARIKFMEMERKEGLRKLKKQQKDDTRNAP